MKKALMFVAGVLLAAAPALVSADEKAGAMDKPASGSKTLQGCLTAKDGGNLVLQTPSEDVQVEGSAELKDHVGHEGKLTGDWIKENTSASASSETSGAGTSTKSTATKKAGSRQFKVASFEHVSATCSTTKK